MLKSSEVLKTYRAVLRHLNRLPTAKDPQSLYRQRLRDQVAVQWQGGRGILISFVLFFSVQSSSWNKRRRAAAETGPLICRNGACAAITHEHCSP